MNKLDAMEAKIDNIEQRLSNKLNHLENRLENCIEQKYNEIDDRITEMYNLTNETNFIKVSLFYILILIINLLNKDNKYFVIANC